ncbi:MAG: DUF1573 domain-containing protein [Candidatus Harrisonbacteria bacterium]|nr:DUF1573 domain-containing protein [Candidatus Harrisonbacteria bacterium]
MKNLKSIIIGVILLSGVVLIVASLSGGNNSDQKNPDRYSASALSAIEETFDFNTISMRDGNVSHKFEIKNDGTEPVVINKVYTSCMCTVAYVINGSDKKYGPFGMPGHTSAATQIEVANGETATVEIIFDPAAHGPSGVGLAQRSVYLETNSSVSPTLEFFFQAMVTR